MPRKGLYSNFMHAHRTEGVVAEDLSLTLHGLPFSGGENVEIIVLPLAEPRSRSSNDSWRKLEGLPVDYPDPFGPAAPLDDWEALR